MAKKNLGYLKVAMSAAVVLVGGFFLFRTGPSFLPGAGHYKITGVRVEPAKERARMRAVRFAPRPPSQTWRIHFTAEWVDGHRPPNQTQECRYEVFDSSGGSLIEGEFGLHVGKGPFETSAPGVLSETMLDGEPKTAEVSC